MKKLIFIFLFFIYFSNLRAEVYDLYKCFRSDFMVDFKGKDIDLQNVKWTDNNFNRANKIIVIDVDKYINILKNLPKDLVTEIIMVSVVMTIKIYGIIG